MYGKLPWVSENGLAWQQDLFERYSAFKTGMNNEMMENLEFLKFVQTQSKSADN